jgi:hypothetical protein
VRKLGSRELETMVQGFKGVKKVQRLALGRAHRPNIVIIQVHYYGPDPPTQEDNQENDPPQNIAAHRINPTHHSAGPCD